ncbi:MAG: IS3 family transposase, partial [Coriobacteriaceae bacterium]|nr:IS3 family transposase [Coriobacteriaceae bacterium]
MSHYLGNGHNASETIRALGCPSHTLLGAWTKGIAPEAVKPRKDRVECSLEQRTAAVASLCDKERTVADVARGTGAHKAGLHEWRGQLLGKEVDAVLPDNDEAPSAENEDDLLGRIAALRKEKEAVDRELYLARLEPAVRQGALELIKKDPGIGLEKLDNRERTVLADALKTTFPLSDLLPMLRLPKSSYYYQRGAIARGDKYAVLRQRVRVVSQDSGGCYGYRRIHAVIVRDGTVVSEKVVARLMAEEGMAVKGRKRRRYSSYAGEISPEAPNLLERDFHAGAPNDKWPTDITEFRIPAGKACLSPIIDCFDGLAVSWTIGTSPNAELVNTMPDKALASLGEGELPKAHSDRGCHYRWPGWIGRMGGAGLERSMSKKGCSPDNAACEGFFGRPKDESFYGRSWKGVAIDGFAARLDASIRWYNDVRVKKSWGCLSPMEYRQSLGLAAQASPKKCPHPPGGCCATIRVDATESADKGLAGAQKAAFRRCCAVFEGMLAPAPCPSTSRESATAR